MKRKERYIARLDEVKITREGDYAFIDYTMPGSKCEGLFAFRPRPVHRADSGHSKRSRSRLRQNDAEHLAKRARIEPWCVGMPSRRRAHFRPTDPEKVRVKYEDAAGIVIEIRKSTPKPAQQWGPWKLSYWIKWKSG
jgi:hypothetical protein